jgi:prepilin-type N-terminal cleavage/methylation domain-containing protein
MTKLLNPRPTTRNPERGTRNRAKGFTLIEVLIALGIFLGAMLAVLGIYFQNLRLARMAREEIIVSMIQRDIMARNQVRASARAGHERAFKRRITAVTPPSFDEYGSPRDGTTYATEPSIGETTDPSKVFLAGWGVRNITTWERASGLHWGRSTPAAESDLALYENFYFIAHPVWRYPDKTTLDAQGNPKYPWVRNKNFNPATVGEWNPATTSGYRGLALEDSQFTDWDGYGMVDMDRDGYPETNRGLPAPSPGPIHSVAPANFPANSDKYEDSPYRIFYNSDKMGYYFMRLRVRIMWQVKLLEEVYNMTDHEVLAAEDGNKALGIEPRRVFNHTEYYFSVVNPDIVKRWQP